MLTDSVAGFRYGYTVTDINRTAPGNETAKLTKQAAETGLSDFQTVGGKPESQKNELGKKHESRYNIDGTLKSESKNGKVEANDEAQKLFNVGETPSGEPVKNAENGHNHDGFDADCPECECETCKNRRYQDDSNDSAVSFQQATAMNPTKARSMVKSHEMEHVRREQHKAKEEGRRVVSQSVQIMTKSCPECGDIYVSGGLTRTQTKTITPGFQELFNVGAEDMLDKGNELNQTA